MPKPAPTLTTPWLVYKWGNTGKYTAHNAPPEDSDLAAFSFPIAGRNVAYVVFLTTTTVSSLLGNLTGKTLNCSFKIETTGTPEFIYGGQGSWNNCNAPAGVRFFISTSDKTYNLTTSNQFPDTYWWSQNSINLQAGEFNLIAALDSVWTNGIGQNNPADFANAISNIKQVGLAFSGGCFYDVAVAIKSNTGTAKFNLISFTV